MTEQVTIELEGEPAMLAFGRQIAAWLSPAELVFVYGDLGAGKTTLIRGILNGLGHRGPVPSPTYTLLETYRLEACEVAHMDLYRLQEADELEMLGVRDFLDRCLCLIEWPERVLDRLPEPDRTIRIDGSGLRARTVVMQAGTGGRDSDKSGR